MKYAVTAAISIALTGLVVPAQKDFYDIDTIQRVSLTFAQPDWEAQL